VGVDGERLIKAAANHLAVADILGPCDVAELNIVGASERVALRISEWRPRSLDVLGGPRPEPPPVVAADGFNDEEIFVLSISIYIGTFEQTESLGVFHRDHRFIEPLWEAGDWGLRAIEVPIVVRGEQMAVTGITDDPKVEPIPFTYVVVDDDWPLGIESLYGAPSAGVADVWIGRIRCIVILEDEVPELLRCEVEDLGRSSVTGTDSRLVEVVERGRVGVGPVGEVGVEHAPITGLCGCCKDVPMSVVEDDGGIFDPLELTLVVFRRD
jgi:hypothetical protein